MVEPAVRPCVSPAKYLQGVRCMANEATGGGTAQARAATSRAAAEAERDAESLGEQIDTLKADLALISSTLADLVRSSAREGRESVERTAEQYMREGR